MNWLAAIGVGLVATGIAYRKKASGSPFGDPDLEDADPIFGLPTKLLDHHAEVFEDLIRTYGSQYPEIAGVLQLAIDGEVTKARAMFREQVTLSTSDVNECYIACRFYSTLWIKKRVEDFAARAMELTPGDVDALIRFHHFHSNLIHEALADHVSTVEDCRRVQREVQSQTADHACPIRALEIEPNNADVCYWYAKQMFENDWGDIDGWVSKSEQILDAANRGARLDPESGKLALLLAEIYSGLLYHDFDVANEAIYWVDRSLELNPGNSDALQIKEDVLDAIRKREQSITPEQA
ncbi:MAG: hypothetical protein GC165_11195 [Armatimonadetes bacterium]|nr:hypothetical protein [Armatimonadota bacterium]